MLAVIMGLLFMLAGGLGIIMWRGEFIVVLKGLAPVMIIVGGFISVVAGATSIAESFESKADGESPTEAKK